MAGGMQFCSGRFRVTALIILFAISSWSQTVEGGRSLDHRRRLQEFCVCTAQYDPVCLEDGTEVASNLCNVRCDPHIEVPEGAKYKKKWCKNPVGSEEPVKVDIPPKSQPVSPEGPAQPAADCFCPAVYQPVCLESGQEVASNLCNVRCNPRIPVTEDMVYKEEWCNQKKAPGRSPLVTVEIPPPKAQGPGKPLVDCVCPTDYDPVCLEDGRELASNPCNVRCNPQIKVPEGTKYKKKWCNSPSDSDWQPVTVKVGPPKAEPATPASPSQPAADCFCPAVYQPVCLENGKEVASNLCNVRCNPRIPVTEDMVYKEEWCNSRPVRNVEIRPKAQTVTPEAETQPPLDCFCPSVYQPVCLENGREVASNLCNVRCNPRIPVTEDMVYKEEWCLQGGPSAGMQGPAVPSPRQATPVHVEDPDDSSRPTGWTDYEAPDDPGASDRRRSFQRSELSTQPFDISSFLPLPQLVDKKGNSYPCCLAKVDLVCSEDGTVVALNPDCAECDEALAGVPYKREWCQNEPAGGLARGGSKQRHSEPPTCDCGREWDPVCDKDGVVIARNRGCARCDGIVVDDYRKEWCPEKVVANRPPELGNTCLCPLHSEPFCDSTGRVVATNRCNGECNGVDFTHLSTKNCREEEAKPGREGPTRRLEGSHERARPRGDGDDEDDDDLPVVDDLPIAVDEVQVDDTRPGPSLPKCFCPLIYAPVCSKDGTKVASSPCEAACKGLDSSGYHMDWCAPKEMSDGTDSTDHEGQPEHPDVPDLPRQGKGQSPKEPPLCMCNRMYKPVCGRDGTEVAPNECMGTCSGLKKGTDFKRSWCDNVWRPLPGKIQGGAQAGVATACSCSSDWLPVCYEDGTFVSPNPCIAMCYGHGAPGKRLMRCSDTSYLPF